MKTKTIYLKNLHFEHKLWVNELKFVKDEISVFESRLGDFVSNQTDNGILAMTEHFQNQFIREKEVVDEMLHEIDKHENALEQYAGEHPDDIEKEGLRDHGNMRDKMERFRSIYDELKMNFRKFLSDTIS